jgi:hypothetical protein
MWVSFPSAVLSYNLFCYWMANGSSALPWSCYYEACPESKDTSRVGRYGNFYAYCGNIVVDLDPSPVSHARLTVVEPALFE